MIRSLLLFFDCFPRLLNLMQQIVIIIKWPSARFNSGYRIVPSVPMHLWFLFFSRRLPTHGVAACTLYLHRETELENRVNANPSNQIKLVDSSFYYYYYNFVCSMAELNPKATRDTACYRTTEVLFSLSNLRKGINKKNACFAITSSASTWTIRE